MFINLVITGSQLQAAQSIASTVTALVGVGGLILAVLGYNGWKKQIIFKEDRELARRIVKDVDEFESRLSAARSPGNSGKDLFVAVLEDARKALVALIVDCTEAEVIFDDPTFKSELKSLETQFARLRIAVRHQVAEIDGTTDLVSAEDRNVLYSSSDYNQERYDDYDTVIYAATKKLLKPARRRLKR